MRPAICAQISTFGFFHESKSSLAHFAQPSQHGLFLPHKLGIKRYRRFAPD